MMRLFIAINFDDETIENILRCQDRLRRLGKGNFTTKENLHLTLAFLGEVPEERLDELKALMDGISVPEMKLRFSRIGCFRGEDELWWIGAEEDRKLSMLQRELTDALAWAGFEPDRKRFKPHITLARRMHVGQVESGKLLKEPFTAEVGGISLMLSHRPDGKLTYTELYWKR